MNTDIKSIDWNAAWQSAMQFENTPRHDAAFWNKHAKSFAGKARHKSDYPEQFINIIQPTPSWKVLDVGCGSGTIAIPLANRVNAITALDFSNSMLDILKRSCIENNITNICPILADWSDDWQAVGIEPHDVVIASRSLITGNLTSTIKKLIHFANKRVIISTIVGQGPFDKNILKAAGRKTRTDPDYIYLINLLHQMGIYAHLDFTVHPINRTFADHQDALDECRWMITNMTNAEEQRLKTFFKKNLVLKKGSWYLPEMSTVRWAVLWWDVN